MQARTSDLAVVNEGNAHAQLGGSEGGRVSARAGAKDDQVEVGAGAGAWGHGSGGLALRMVGGVTGTRLGHAAAGIVVEGPGWGNPAVLSHAARHAKPRQGGPRATTGLVALGRRAERDDQGLQVRVAAVATATDQPRSASCGMPIGATRTRPATADPRRARSPVLGLWNVTVTCALTTGSERSPLVRSTAVGVSTARMGMPALLARPIRSTALRIGSRSGPWTPVPRSASTTTAAFSIP